MAGANVIDTGPRTRNFIKLVDADTDSVVVTVAAASTPTAKWTAIEAECPAAKSATGGELSCEMTSLESFFGEPNSEEVPVFAKRQAVNRPRQLSGRSITIPITLYNPSDVLHRALRTAGFGQRVNFVSVLIGDDTASGDLQTVADTAAATAESFFGVINVAAPGVAEANGDRPLNLTIEVKEVNPAPIDQA